MKSIAALPSERELNQVFLLRKKVGLYKRIPHELKQDFLELFYKVI